MVMEGSIKDSVMRVVTRADPPKYRLLGVPSSAGAMFTGTEAAPAAFRAADVVRRLGSAGRAVVDDGDIALPPCLPRHDVPPVRNWPSPRIVWQLVSDAVGPLMVCGDIPLLLGGDCSVVVGTASALAVLVGADAHVIYIDGHLDAVPPDSERCLGAGAMGLWFATNPSRLWSGAKLTPGQVHVLGCADLQSVTAPIPAVMAAEVRARGAIAAAHEVLEGIPSAARLLVHFDVDVIAEAEMPAAYSPNPDGLASEIVAELLRIVLHDSRVAAIEVAEYTTQRDLDGVYARRVVEMLAAALPVCPGTHPSPLPKASAAR